MLDSDELLQPKGGRWSKYDPLHLLKLDIFLVFNGREDKSVHIRAVHSMPFKWKVKLNNHYSTPFFFFSFPTYYT